MSRTLPPVPTHAPGDLLAGRFRVVRFLGAGAVGEVFECEDTALEGRVAVKGLRPELAADAEAVARLRRELHLTRAVTHPNVCRTYDAFVDGAGRLYLTMELLAGETLEAHLARRGRLPAAEAAAVLRQIADGLAAAHAAGVVHRDLKTGNVFLVGEGDERRVVVADFGLAREELAGGSSVTRTGDVVGSPAYMAPEQVRGEPATPATDVYALGVVAYELVTGELPFQGETGFVTAVKRLTEPPPPPRRRVPELPAAWDRAVLACLSADPAGRPADPRELPRRLQERRRPPDGAEEADAARQARRQGGVALAAGLVLVAAAAVGWGLLGRSAPGRAASAGTGGGAAERPAGAATPVAAVVAAEPGAVPAAAEGRAVDSSATTLPGPRGSAPGPPVDPPPTAAAPAAPAPRLPPGSRQDAENEMAAGNEHFHGGRIAEARAAYERALPLWRALDAPDREAAALNNVANTLAIEGRLEEATPYYEQALELRRRAGDDESVSRALEGLGRHLFRLGDTPGARRRFEEAVVLARSGGRHTEAARLLLNLSAVLRTAGDDDQAERAIRAAVDLYHQEGKAESAAAAERSLAELLLGRGRLAAALEPAERALDAVVRAGDAQGEAAVRKVRAEILHALGRGEAEAELERARLLWRQTGSRAAEARAACDAARWRLEDGDLDGGRGELLPALAELEEIGGNEGLHEALALLAEVRRLEGDGAAARAAAERAVALSRELERATGVARGLVQLARLSLDDGLPAEAIALARAAAADLAGHGRVDEARLAALLLSEAHLASGDATAAERELAASGAAGSEAVRVRWRAALLAARQGGLVGDPGAAEELARLEAEAAAAGWAALAVEAALARARQLAAGGDADGAARVAAATAQVAAASGLELYARQAAAISRP